MSKISGRMILLAGSLAASLGATIAHADAPCNKGYRDTTAAERAAVGTVLESVKKAFPPAPAGWAIVGDDGISVPTRLCRDSEAEPWAYGFSRTYSNATRHEAREQTARDAAAGAVAEAQKKQPLLDAAQKRMIGLMQQQTALVQKGDYAGAEKLEPERAKAEKDYQALMDEIYRPAVAATAQAFRDIEIGVSSRVNGLVEWQGNMQKAQAPAGAHSAYRWTTTKDDIRTGHALVLLGQWGAGQDGKPAAVPRPGGPATAARSISISVHAEESRVQAILNGIDFASLAKLAPK